MKRETPASRRAPREPVVTGGTLVAHAHVIDACRKMGAVDLPRGRRAEAGFGRDERG